MTQATRASTILGAIRRLFRGRAIFAGMMAATALRSGIFCRSIRKHPHAPEWADQEGENDSDRVKRTKHGSFFSIGRSSFKVKMISIRAPLPRKARRLSAISENLTYPLNIY